MEKSEFKKEFKKEFIKEWIKHNQQGWCVPEGDPEPYTERTIMFFKSGKQIHGLGYLGNPRQRLSGFHDRNFRNATKQEIQERLFDSEQCQQYIDADYQCLTGGTTFKGKFNHFKTNKRGEVWAILQGGANNLICDKDGEWAEIKEEPSLKDKVNEMWAYYKSIEK